MYISKKLQSHINSKAIRFILNASDVHLTQNKSCKTQCNREQQKKKKSKKEEKKSSEKQCSSEIGKDEAEKSSVPRIGINGFGRIGRMVMRVATEHSCPIEIIAINDQDMTSEQMAYLLKYDSTHGRFVNNVEVSDKKLTIEGKSICTYKEKDPKNIPWKDLKIDYVIEASGKFKSVKKAEAHIENGAKKVVIAASSDDAPMYILGANSECYDPTSKVVSCGSCSTNALAPLAKVVHDNFQIEEAMMTTIHSVTMSQALLDSPISKNWRSGRGAFQNSIPFTTGAGKAIGRILPDLEGKLTATSIRVPLANVSLFDITCRLCKKASMKDIENAMCEAKNGPMLGILDVTSDEVVSSDFIGSPYSCTYDTKASLALNDKFVKLIAWYDNEYGYTCRVIDLIKFMHAEQLSNDNNKC